MTVGPKAVAPTGAAGKSVAANEVFNAVDYLVDRQVRAGNGGRIAVVAGDRTLDYRTLATETHRAAAGLARLGLRPEQRVMFAMADDVELLTGILGAMYLGAVPVPVSTMVTGQELGSMLADSRARILCLSTEFAAAGAAALAIAPEVTDVVLDGPADFAPPRPGVRVEQWSALLRDGDGEPVSGYDTWPDSPALWLYTSGTTGLPKAAMHRHANIPAVTETYAAQVLGIRPEDRCLSVPKLFFAYGLGNSAFFPLSVGASAVLERARPTPKVIADRIRRTEPTLFFAVPTFYAALLGSDIPDHTFATVRQAVSAGEPLPPVLCERFRHRFGVEILDGLGSTEALHIFLSNRPGQVRPGSTGVPVPGYEIELRDELGTVITAPDTPGELYLRGPSIATGYWCRTDTTRRVFQGEWLRTGDTYQRAADGSYTCLGRSDDMFKAGGIWVSPAEVEGRLLEHPDVVEAAVVAAPDVDGLDKPVACVVPLAGQHLDGPELIDWCLGGLAAFKRPRAVVLLDELPKTATGKIRRNVLRDQVKDELRHPVAH